MAERESFQTPIVTFIYPKISSPDTYGAKADGRFKTQFQFDTPEAADKFSKWLRAKAKAMMPKCKKPKLPWNDQEDDEGNPTGERWFRAGSKYRPLVVDSKNRNVPETVNIGGGTRGRLELALNAYDDRLSIYLNGVQITELKEFVRGARKSNFEAIEDGFEVDTDESVDGDESDGEGEAGADDFGAEEGADEPF